MSKINILKSKKNVPSKKVTNRVINDDDVFFNNRTFILTDIVMGDRVCRNCDFSRNCNNNDNILEIDKERLCNHNSGPHCDYHYLNGETYQKVYKEYVEN